ncbi:hypothetical protein APF79_03060 [bacterium BRH_c32]|nr:MAG: hypothetical protein APF79_03060 [bacterium BRH_c32]
MNNKKLEIVIENIELDNLCRILDNAKVTGYTIIPEVTGKGALGKKITFGLSDIIKYAMIIIIESDEKTKEIIEKIKPIMRTYSGIAFISDTEIIDFK